MPKEIRQATIKTGLIGWPVEHSLSPAMHRAAASQLGLELTYEAIAVRPAELDAFMGRLLDLGYRGLNVTIPHKQAVMPYLDEIAPAARAIGAVNTIVAGSPAGDGGRRMTGRNTDWSGFMADLQALSLEMRGQSCLVLGAGGSARAVAYGLATAGNRVHLFARRKEQAEQVVASLAAHGLEGALSAFDLATLPEQRKLLEEVALVVNCTPLGMSPNSSGSAWPDGLDFPSQAFLYDLVYTPAETRIMGQARAAGCRAANGLGMLARQGAQAFTLWTGLEPDIQVMIQAIRR